ncbi:excisionase [Variovorax guangxiensis]|uniref:Excisionase n=1 Tax=Variovorax guangxiensis TaxID=1775474 RepID=A0A433MDC4_9BURK|nr:excisionase [Variovorax guangxiensis]RUR65873.1 excisionase [Variovorax guangxiensis]
MKPKIRLTAWAALHFDPPPAERTLRLWGREGRVIPPPLKIGRTYYIDQDAQHVAEIAAVGRLVNRLRRT